MRRLLATIAGIFLAASVVSGALANGTPVKIDLTKINGVTNFGAPTARGVAEITVVEGDTKVTVTGLERLTNELYQAWLVNTKTGDRVPIAKFNTTADGVAVQNSVVALGNKEYDLFVVTVEPEPDPSPDADGRIVLAGYWPKREPAATQTAIANLTPGPNSATPGPSGTATVPADTPTLVPPRSLPRTGEPGAGVLFIGLGTLGAGLWVFGRRASR